MRIKVFGASGRLGCAIVNQIKEPFVLGEDPDLYIDASMPDGVAAHLETALLKRRPIVIGVTALSDETQALMRKAAETIAVFYSPNFSLGAALLKKFAKFLANTFHEEADIDLIETHHVHKKDSPSGTAAAIAKDLRACGRKLTLHSIRSGQTVGIHELIFNTAEERISFAHTAHSLGAFARGALVAATFLENQGPGLYGMEDLLVGYPE